MNQLREREEEGTISIWEERMLPFASHLPAHQLSGGDQTQPEITTPLSSILFQHLTSLCLSSVSSTLLSFLYVF